LLIDIVKKGFVCVPINRSARHSWPVRLTAPDRQILHNQLVFLQCQSVRPLPSFACRTTPKDGH
jgi:hypothetical protein